MSGDRRFKRSIVALLSVLVLVACAPGAPAPSSVQPSAAATPQASAEPLDCETLGYPCSLADVPAEIAQRSMDLGDDAWERIDTGSSAAEVGAWLAEQPGMAELRWTDTAIRFRLEGGRPTWISTQNGESAQAAESAPSAQRSEGTVFARKAALGPDDRAPHIRTSQSVAMNGVAEKKAIILSPFKWELGAADPGDRVAELMRQTRGYASGVTYLENATHTSSDITVDTFAHLDGNALVYLTSLSTKICEDGSEGPYGGVSPGPGNCWSVIGAQEYYGDLNKQTAKGVELVKFKGDKWTLCLNSDFFKAHYATGVEDAILLFNVPDIWDMRLRAFMSGATSEYLGWDNVRPTAEGGEITMKFLQRLAETGSTVDTVFQELKNELQAGAGKLFSLRPEAGGSLRLRETVQLRDPITGGHLDEIGEVNVATKLGDGQPDHVPFMVDIDGLTPEQAEQTTINVFFDNWEVRASLASEGEQVGESTYRVEAVAEIRDLHEGETLQVTAYAQLPEGGLSKDTATVRVAGLKKVELGRVWKGTVTSVVETINPGVNITRVAEVEFTLDPNDQVGDDLAYYYVSGGHLTWSISGSDRECSYSGESGAVPLDANEFNFLVFDVSGGATTYRGWGNNDDGPSVEVQVTCKTRSFTYGSGAEGLWWGMAPSEWHPLQGDTLQGESRDGATIESSWVWELHKVE